MGLVSKYTNFHTKSINLVLSLVRISGGLPNMEILRNLLPGVFGRNRQHGVTQMRPKS